MVVPLYAARMSDALRVVTPVALAYDPPVEWY
jgi:hypothetical protein